MLRPGVPMLILTLCCLAFLMVMFGRNIEFKVGRDHRKKFDESLDDRSLGILDCLTKTMLKLIQTLEVKKNQ